MIKVTCSICTEMILFRVPEDDKDRENKLMMSTRCGHIFHNGCLKRWMDIASSCPSCRVSVKKTENHRLFFEFAPEEVIKDDLEKLTIKLTSAEFNIKLKDTTIEKLKIESETYKQQRTLLKKDLLKFTQNEGTIDALRHQVKSLKNEITTCYQYKEEVQQLRNELTNYVNVKRLLTVNNDDGQEMIRETKDVHSLQTYLIVIKRQLELAMKKRSDYQKTLNDVKRERDHLAADLKKEREVIADLKNRIEFSEETARLGRDSSGQSNDDSVICIDDQLPKKNSNDLASYRRLRMSGDSEDEENSSTFRFNSQKDLKRKIPRSSASISANSILLKKPRIPHKSLARPGSMEDDGMITSDGLGGYKKVDSFPVSSGVKSKVVLPKQTRKLFK